MPIIYILSFSFDNCTSLTNIKFPNNAVFIDGDVFESTAYYKDEGNWENDILYAGTCLLKARDNVSGVCCVREGTTTIAAGAFAGNANITTVELPDTVKIIGSRAFERCISLENINIPESVMH